MNNETYKTIKERIERLINLKEHHIIKEIKKDIRNMEFKTENINKVSDLIIEKYNNYVDKIDKEYKIKKASEHITPLKLQKLLYYVQGMSLFYFNKEAFSNKIMAWSYGPVVEEIYEQYKRNGKAEINLFVRDNDVSKGLNEIIDEVVKYYGKYSATWLVELTHDEDPWKDTEHNQEISKEKIKKYFEEVYK